MSKADKHDKRDEQQQRRRYEEQAESAIAAHVSDPAKQRELRKQLRKDPIFAPET